MIVLQKAAFLSQVYINLFFFFGLYYNLVFYICMWMVVVLIPKSGNVNKKQYLANVTKT